MGASIKRDSAIRLTVAGVSLLLAVLFLAVAVPSSSSAASGISGTWDCCGDGGAAEQDFIITDTGGSLSGKAVQPGGQSFAVISGSYSGSSVTIVTTYEASFDPGYVATFTGTVSGTTMTGSWVSNVGQSGTWTATLAGAAPEEPETTKPKKLGSSFTAVSCTISAVAPDTSTCTAQVAGYGTKALVSPTGTVSFTAASGTVGSSCSLVATAGSPGISSCTVSYLPSPSLPVGQPAPVTAAYSGNASFKPSSATTSFIPRSVVVGEDEPFDDAVEVPDGGSSEGIPVALTNTNPFAVSADEQLTVSGYPSVANSSEAARTQVIGSAAYKVAPLHTIATKVKLSRGGAKLLKRHKRLPATLIITTKRPGQKSRTLRLHLLLET